MSGLSEIEALAGHLALMRDGTVWVWGVDPLEPFRTKPSAVRVDDITEVVAVAGDPAHNLAVKRDGTVWAWGINDHGELGDGTRQWSRTPVQASGLTGAAKVAAGGHHSLALKDDGTVWTWGDNGFGQLGDGTTATTDLPGRAVPMQVSGLAGVTAIAAGFAHSLALKGDGTVWAWGANERGQLGDGTTENRPSPVLVSGLTGVVVIAAGAAHSLAVKSDGTVWAWGSNDYGQLGDGTTTGQMIPVQVHGLSGAASVSGGSSHTLALRGDGTIWAWGNDQLGQLGDGTRVLYSQEPVQVNGLTEVPAIAAGGVGSLAVKTDGTVSRWGARFYGASLHIDATPVQVSGLTGVVAVSARGLALKADGTVWHFGDSEPFPIVGLNDVIAIAPEAWTPLAVKRDGTVWQWDIQITPLNDAVAVAGMAFGGLAVKADGTVWGFIFWGMGDVPGGLAQIKDLTDVVAVAGDYFAGLALKRDGTVWESPAGEPGWAQVNGLTGVVSIALGGRQGLALRDDSTVWEWGQDYFGPGYKIIGPGSATKTTWPTPRQVVGLTEIVKIAAGAPNLALRRDGTVWAWGDNLYGQLDGGPKRQLTPVQVVPLGSPF